MAKLPVKIKAHLDKVQEQWIPHAAKCATQIIFSDTSIPGYVACHTADYYNGLLQGYYAQIEAILSAYNCYRGYMEKEEQIRVKTANGLDGPYTYSYHVYCF